MLTTRRNPVACPTPTHHPHSQPRYVTSIGLLPTTYTSFGNYKCDQYGF